MPFPTTLVFEMFSYIFVLKKIGKKYIFVQMPKKIIKKELYIKNR